MKTFGRSNRRQFTKHKVVTFYTGYSFSLIITPLGVANLPI
ncbi:hypothetical protein [Algoriphagus marinus]|nr:hypothetical protein [Algoriphagus marinus]